jgi:hypothetical protein
MVRGTYDIVFIAPQRKPDVVLCITSFDGPFGVYGLASEAPSLTALPMIAGYSLR